MRIRESHSGCGGAAFGPPQAKSGNSRYLVFRFVDHRACADGLFRSFPKHIEASHECRVREDSATGSPGDCGLLGLTNGSAAWARRSRALAGGS